ncbi:hypothetical protein BDV98DRAFT_273679 [Pterulicium gracile]|uniref:Uncharacterized protein n=1 Tax=Pterulicium gracile TaxID=1884261 RepID=A0A5C3Q797_9AGAR|nr:hypothetical protein BDV98DRAFT_273679 [Pterula gracilis]
MSHSNFNNPISNNNAPLNRSPTMPHSEPIPIGGSFRNRNRQRSASLSSGSSITSSGSDLPPSPVNSPHGTSPRVGLPSPATSPILSYFLAQSPTKTSATGASLPFRSNFASNPVFEEEESPEIPAAKHARRASTIGAAARFSNGGMNAATPASPSADKGAGLLRRLSLGSAAFAKPLTDTTTATRDDAYPPVPRAPPNSTVATEAPEPLPHVNKPKRSATVSNPSRPRRAPSPMGERILKGHFDGFN